MEAPLREAARAASPLLNIQTTDPACLVPRKGRRKLPTAWALGLSVVAIAIALCAILSQTSAVRRWQLMRRPLTALIHDRSRNWDDAVYLGVLGQRLNQQGRYTEADPVLRRCVGLDPDEAAFRDEWARALLGSGLTTAAFGELKEFVGTHPASADGHCALGKFYLTQFSYPRADEELRTAVALDGGNAEAWAFLAQAADNLQDRARAAKAAEHAVHLQEKNAAYHRLLAGILAELSDADGARRHFAQAIALAPRDAQAHREYAQWLLNQARSPTTTSRALGEAQQAAALSPADGATLFVLGQALDAAGQSRAALPPLRQAAQALPDATAPTLVLAQLCRRLGRPSEAESWDRERLRRQDYTEQVRRLTQDLSIRPEDHNLHTRLAQLAGRHGEVGTCVRHHAMALHCATDSPLAMIAASHDLTEGGYALLALPLAERAVQVARQNGMAFEALGDVLLALGKYDAAVKEYQTAVNWNLDRKPIVKARLERYVAAQAADAERYYQEAARFAATEVGLRTFTPQTISLVQKALSIQPSNPRYLHFLLDAQIAQKKMADAAQTAQRLVQLAPRDAQAHAVLAVLLTNTATSESDYRAIEGHLQAAAGDPVAAATRHYGLGLLAVRRHQATLAVTELTTAARLDPTADVTFYKLAQAEQAAGDSAAAARAMAVYQKRQEAKRQEAALLSNVGAHRNQADAYVRLASLYQRHGQPLQAQAVLAAARSRCSSEDLRRAQRKESGTS